MDRKVIDVSSLSLSFCLLLWLSTYLPTNLSMYPSIHLSIYPSIHLSIYPSIHVCLSVYLSICKLENEAILRDVLTFWTWQHQKRSNSARLPQCLNLTTSKTKQFCQTSSMLELNNVKNEAILRDFLNFRRWQHQKRSNSARPPSKMESCMQRWRPRTNAFCDFSNPFV